MSYRRNTLKQTFRESFGIVKHFTHLLYPSEIDQNGDLIVHEPDDSEPIDIEKELLKEAEKEKSKEQRVFHIFETGVSQTLFMEVRGDFDTTKVVDKMWTDILDGSVNDKTIVPTHLERLLPITFVCEAKEEIIKVGFESFSINFLYIWG